MGMKIQSYGENKNLGLNFGFNGIGEEELFPKKKVWFYF